MKDHGYTTAFDGNRCAICGGWPSEHEEDTVTHSLGTDGVMELSFSDSCDAYTFQNLFGEMSRMNYVVAINGVDYELQPMSFDGFVGRAFDGNDPATPGPAQLIPWEQVSSLKVY